MVAFFIVVCGFSVPEAGIVADSIPRTAKKVKVTVAVNAEKFVPLVRFKEGRLSMLI